MPNQENDMNEVITRLTRIETKIDTYKPQLDDHEARIRELEGKAGKKWESVITAIIAAIVGGIVGYFINKII